MAEQPVMVVDRNSTVPIILSLIAAAVIAFALWFFVIDEGDQGDDVLPDITVTSVGS